jgi:hypothetical protein
MNEFEELKDLSVQELRIYKYYLVEEIKKLQRMTREIDKEVKGRLKNA